MTPQEREDAREALVERAAQRGFSVGVAARSVGMGRTELRGWLVSRGRLDLWETLVEQEDAS